MKRITLKIENWSEEDKRMIGLQIQKQTEFVDKEKYFFDFEILDMSFKDCFLSTINYGSKDNDPIELIITANQ